MTRKTTAPADSFGGLSDQDARVMTVGASRPGLLGKAGGAARFVGYVWRHPANEHRRARALARASLFQIRARVLRLPTVVPLGERSRILADLGSAASVQVAFANPPDPGEWAVWAKMLRPGDVFLDVGANIGTYALMAAERGAAVTAFEPDPENADKLRRNLALNGYAARVEELALAAEPGAVLFTDGLDTRNHVLVGNEKMVASRMVRVETLDRLFPDGLVRGVKIDVEGAEGMVLRGAEQALAAGRIGLLQLEWNLMSRVVYGELRSSVLDLLTRHGYALYRADLDGTLVPDKGDEGPRDAFASRPATAAALNASVGPLG